MPDIPNIGIRGIQPVKIHSWLIQPPVVSAIEVPVTVNIGTPVVLLPGCVTSHPLSNKSKTIAEDDPKGVKHIVMRTHLASHHLITLQKIWFIRLKLQLRHVQARSSRASINSRDTFRFPRTNDHPAPNKTRKRRHTKGDNPNPCLRNQSRQRPR